VGKEVCVCVKGERGGGGREGRDSKCRVSKHVLQIYTRSRGVGELRRGNLRLRRSSLCVQYSIVLSLSRNGILIPLFYSDLIHQH
jgi:hypothetical protein